MFSFIQFLGIVLSIVVLTIVCAIISAVVFAVWYLTFTFSGWIAFCAVPLTYLCWWGIAKLFSEAHIFD